MLIIGVSLTTDLGGSFIPGNRINTYWDDVAEDVVVKLEEFSYVYGSNIGTWGDDGDFETTESNWLRADATNELHGVPSLTRSSDIVSFSALYTHAYGGRDNRIAWQIAEGAEVGKTYLCTCQVRTDGAFPLGADNLTFQLRPRYPFMSYNQETQVVTTQADADGVWVEIRTWVTILSDSELDPIIELRTNQQDMTIGGKVYIDQFYVREDLHPTSSENTVITGPDLGQVSQSQCSNAIRTTHGSGGGTKYTPTSMLWSVYQFCDSTTLNRFSILLTNPAFPYVTLQPYIGHPNCAASPIVCNIHFTGSPTVTPASNPVALDGAITVLAISTLSSVRYSNGSGLKAYLDLENTTGEFTGLRSGVYQIIAGDSAGCQVTISVYVPSTIANNPQPTNTEPTYGEKLRMEHGDLMNGVTSRTDILERNFSGDPIDVKGSSSPVIRALLADQDSDSAFNNKFECLRSTTLEMNLVSERDLQFIGLFSQDDRKFLVKHYKPVGTLLWSGFIVPSVFSEAYTEGPPYYTSISISDNLTTLSDIDFLDADGNSLEGDTPLINIVALILQKLSLGLDIRVACNMQEDSDTYDEPQAFEKTTKELSSFYEDDGAPWKCSRVLEAILKPFGAKLVQENGVWNIVRIEEQTEEYDYRQYDKDGEYLSSDSYDPIVEISDPSLRLNAVFKDRGHTLEVVPGIGTLNLTRILHPVPNMVKNGSFDQFDDSGVNSWTITAVDGVNHQVTPIKKAVQIVRNGVIITEEGSNALEISNLGSSYCFAYPVQFPVEYSNADNLTFSFNYRVNLTDASTERGVPSPLWVKLEWSLKIGDFWFNTVTGWNELNEQHYNAIYIDKFNSDETFETQVRFRNVPSVTTESVSMTFWVYGSTFPDCLDNAGLRLIDTANTPLGRRIRMVSPSFIYYTLVASTEADDSSDWIRPHDYNASTNAAVWHKDVFIDESEGHRSVAQVYLDEVKFQIFPSKNSPPVQELISIVNNENYKENLTLSIEGGDLPSTPLHSKRFLYNNYFKDSSGFSTGNWSRANVNESTTLQQILAKSIINQYKYPTFKVSGSFLGLSELNFLSTLKQTFEATPVTISNEEFTSDVTGWTNYDPGYGSGSWAYGSDSARVTVSAAIDPDNQDLDSEIFRTNTTINAGTRLLIEVSITRSGTTYPRSDWVQLVFFQDDLIVQTAVLTQFDYDGDFVRALKISVAQDCTSIGFKIKNLPFPDIQNGAAQYDMNYFRVSALDVVRYFTVNTMSKDEANNDYQVELMQLVPVVPGADPTIDDSGEGNTNTEGGSGGGTNGTGSSSGSSFNGDFNDDYGSDFDNILF